MKTSYFFVTAATESAAKERAAEVIRDMNLLELDYDVLTATDIGHGEFEVGVTASASATRKLRRALSAGDAE